MTQPERHRRRAGEAISYTARISSSRMMQMRTKPHSSLKILEEQLPKRSYVYAIHIDGVLRYIGKRVCEFARCWFWPVSKSHDVRFLVAIGAKAHLSRTSNFVGYYARDSEWSARIKKTSHQNSKSSARFSV